MSRIKEKEHYRAILRLMAERIQYFTVEEIELFFQAFFTSSEIIELCDRVKIVQGLVSGKTQRQIAQDVGVSSTKVTAGSKEIQFGVGKEVFKKFNFNLQNL
jgi:Trp operon repressor